MSSQKRRAIAVVRASTDLQDTEWQKRDISAAAKVHNLTIVRWLELDGFSGTKMLTNAEVGRVLDDLSRPDIDGVCISAIDRLTRPGELGHLAIFDAFQRTGKKIWTPGQEIDASSQAGFLTLGIQGVISGVERFTILSRLAGGKETVRLRGGNADGSTALPRGLEYTKSGGWKYVEPDATRIRLAYDLLLERRSWRDIAARIGRGCHFESIRRSLMNPCWKGFRRYTKGRESPLEVPLGIPPLVSPERWEAAQRIILEKHSAWRKTKKPPRFLLSGLLRCTCGKPFYVRCSSERAYYFCSSGFPGRGPKCGARSLQREAADRAVERIAATQLLDAAFLKAVLAQLQSGQPARNQSAEKLARERANLEAERQRLLRLTLKGICTDEDFARESKRIEAELRSLDPLLHTPLPEAFDSTKVVIRITRAFARFGKQPFEERRGVLQAAFREIVVQNGAIPRATLSGAWLSACVNSSQRLKPRHSPRFQGQASVPRRLQSLGHAAAFAAYNAGPEARFPAREARESGGAVPSTAGDRRAGSEPRGEPAPDSCLRVCSHPSQGRDALRSPRRTRDRDGTARKASRSAPMPAEKRRS